EAGSGKREAGSGKREAGSGKREAGSDERYTRELQLNSENEGKQAGYKEKAWGLRRRKRRNKKGCQRQPFITVNATTL
ncbi:hypothetical protein WKG88_21550, partial [Pantoea agglomerans]|uniref:hypothetical protein n=1 Tax=Enterobacter agglomerans TaxID=549 RepID=UPI003C7DC751